MVPRRAPVETPSKVERVADVRDVVLSEMWRGHIRTVERALGRHDVDQARRAWEKAHVAAVESFSWEGLLASGQASLRIGGAIGARSSAETAARRAYFTALYRACRENSCEGILRTAEAFFDLGDREIVEECLGLAELQGDSEETRRRVAAFAGRLGALPPTMAGGASPVAAGAA